MSLAAVRTLFRTRLNGLGFKEHSDAFDDSNRPQQILEKLYRLDSGPVTGSPANSRVYSFQVPISLVITLRGKLDNIKLSDRAWVIADEVLADILQPVVENGVVIKSIVPGEISVAPYSESDDNDCVLTMGFDSLIICSY